MIPITVCMITKNEEGTIEKALKAIKQYPFELIVCDTGSTDSTRDIALKYADKVVDFEWINDFSAARNYCASFASNDWIMAIDSDEYITEINMDELEKMMRNGLTCTGRILISSAHYGISSSEEALDNTAMYIDRIYNKKYLCFMNKIHEQIRTFGNKEPEGFFAPVKVDHSGYAVSKDKIKEKNQRNIALLKSALEDALNANPPMPDKEIAYLHFQLGVSYSATRDFMSAHFHFEKAFSFNLPRHLDFVHMLAVKYGISLLNIGCRAQAKEYVQDMLPSFSHYADFLFMTGFVYKMNDEYLSAILYFIRATAAPNCTEKAMRTHLPYHQIGECYTMLGQYDMARMFFEKCGNYQPSKEALVKLDELIKSQEEQEQ